MSVWYMTIAMIVVVTAFGIYLGEKERRAHKPA